MDPVTACQEFIQTHSAGQIAVQLQHDSLLCKTGGRPSFLAVFLPNASTDLADEISKHLLLQDDGHEHSSIELPRAVRTLWYNGLVDGIKSFLGQLRVTSYLQLSTLKECEVLDTHTTSEVGAKTYIVHPRQQRNRLCYICRFAYQVPHSLSPSLCGPCGSFNLANSLISLPGSLDLQGMTALVTGGRVNLGYSTALRLLRCGARVIVSSRYPRDAEVRYYAECDSIKWRKRLKIVGADFRTAMDAFNLVKAVKEQVSTWSKSGCLDILINNAAQTLTDPLRTEMLAVEQEKHLKATSPAYSCLPDNHYQARLRGGNDSAWGMSLQWHEKPVTKVQSLTQEAEKLDGGDSLQEEPGHPGLPKPLTPYQAQQVQDLTLGTSWVQSMNEIPYEDLMSAHSVNFFVPLILCRELLAIMGKTKAETRQSQYNDGLSERQRLDAKELGENDANHANGLKSTKPLGYIINVSSREGIFEDKIGSEAKNGKHVHTNTSKAALNMITETEAENCWRQRRVAMNTVDPGYMSAAPEMHKYGKCPITFEDGAARVLWPIAVAEKEGENLYGRFFKHFGAADVDVGVGR